MVPVGELAAGSGVVMFAVANGFAARQFDARVGLRMVRRAQPWSQGARLRTELVSATVATGARALHLAEATPMMAVLLAFSYYWFSWWFVFAVLAAYIGAFAISSHWWPAEIKSEIYGDRPAVRTTRRDRERPPHEDPE